MVLAAAIAQPSISRDPLRDYGLTPISPTSAIPFIHVQPELLGPAHVGRATQQMPRHRRRDVKEHNHQHRLNHGGQRRKVQRGGSEQQSGAKCSSLGRSVHATKHVGQS